MASESKHPSVTLTRPEGSTPLPAFVVPRLLRIQDAARYLSATTWQVETLLREKTIPSLVLGKRRVIDRSELDRYVERRNAEAKAPSENDKDDQGCSSNAALTFSRTCSESVTPRQTWVVSREQRAKNRRVKSPPHLACDSTIKRPAFSSSPCIRRNESASQRRRNPSHIGCILSETNVFRER
jgi:excisionase family DNA binding protein